MMVQISGAEYVDFAVTRLTATGDSDAAAAVKVLLLLNGQLAQADRKVPATFASTHLIAASAWTLREELAKKLGSLQSNRDLSAEAKFRETHLAVALAQGQLADLEQQWQSAYDAAIARAEARLAPSPAGGTDVLAVRDAALRVESLQNESEALSLLNASRRLNDTMLVDLTVRTAIDKGWRGVVDAYLQTAPEASADIEALWQGVQHVAAHIDAAVDAYAFTPLDAERAITAAGPAVAEAVPEPANAWFAGVTQQRTPWKS